MRIQESSAGKVPPWVRRFGWAMLIAAGAIGLRLLFEPYMGASGFAIFLIAIVAAAWVGGIGPSLFAQTLILVATALWFTSATKARAQNPVQAIVGIVAFYAVGSTIALLSDARRRAHDRELRQQQDTIAQREQLRATLSCMGDGVLVTDTLGRLTSMNPAAEKLTGWSIVDAGGRPIEEVFVVGVDGADSAASEPFERLFQQPAHDPRPLVLFSKRGQSVPITYSAAPIFDGAGADQQNLGHVLVVRDETEQRRTTQALRESDRKKDEFLATLAHELRNPLAPICTGLELMKVPGQSCEEIAEVQSIMERQAKHMVRLIDDLLDVSRITRGRLELRKRTVALAEIVRNAIEETQYLFDEAEHRLTVNLPTRSVLLSVDPNRMTQVLSNLLSNAAKYTPARGSIDLTAEQCDGSLLLSVRDNGLGIPADQLGYVFEMFAQINGTAERGHTGLGIGLMLVKRLVEMHGGTVQVQSAGRNQGTSFQITLPTWAASTDTLPPSRPTSVLTRNSHGLRILVVDDNEDALKTLTRMVAALGHEVEQAKDGRAAVAAVAEFRPQVVLMDLGMPIMNGYEAAAHIRELPDGKQILLVATTGWGQDEDRQRTHQAGFDSHLVKPIDLDTLRKLLEQHAGQRRLADDYLSLNA